MSLNPGRGIRLKGKNPISGWIRKCSKKVSVAFLSAQPLVLEDINCNDLIHRHPSERALPRFKPVPTSSGVLQLPPIQELPGPIAVELCYLNGNCWASDSLTTGSRYTDHNGGGGGEAFGVLSKQPRVGFSAFLKLLEIKSTALRVWKLE